MSTNLALSSPGYKINPEKIKEKSSFTILSYLQAYGENARTQSDKGSE